MRLIKRYPNRKLYDTVSKRYIALAEIADLIRQSEDIQVVDSSSGEDLTNLTLTQVILEQEKNSSGQLPRSILSGLIRATGNRRHQLLRTLGLSLGLGQFINDEIQRRLNILVMYKEITLEEAEYIAQKLISSAYFHSDELQKSLLQDLVVPLERLMRELGIPSREDIQQMMKEIDRLADIINELEK